MAFGRHAAASSGVTMTKLITVTMSPGTPRRAAAPFRQNTYEPRSAAMAYVSRRLPFD